MFWQYYDKEGEKVVKLKKVILGEIFIILLYFLKVMKLLSYIKIDSIFFLFKGWTVKERNSIKSDKS